MSTSSILSKRDYLIELMDVFLPLDAEIISKNTQMKHFKKLSRNDLKDLKGSKRPGVPGNCCDQCSIGRSSCEAYGLTCQLYWVFSPDGIPTSGCMKCI